jgi:hypothetical protein
VVEDDAQLRLVTRLGCLLAVELDGRVRGWRARHQDNAVIGMSARRRVVRVVIQPLLDERCDVYCHERACRHHLHTRRHRGRCVVSGCRNVTLRPRAGHAVNIERACCADAAHEQLQRRLLDVASWRARRQVADVGRRAAGELKFNEGVRRPLSGARPADSQRQLALRSLPASRATALTAGIPGLRVGGIVRQRRLLGERGDRQQHNRCKGRKD